MMQNVLVKCFAAPPLHMREVLRYAGLHGTPDAAACALLDECLREALDGLSYRTCYVQHPITLLDEVVDLGYATVHSADLSRCLTGCSEAVTFVATVGPLPDRMVARYSAVTPARALFHQAIGAERIESLCDTLVAMLRAEQGITLRPRFSPGYGDLSLTVQRDIFRALKPERHIGVSMTDALLMLPSKSVTAIVGIKKE